MTISAYSKAAIGVYPNAGQIAYMERGRELCLRQCISTGYRPDYFTVYSSLLNRRSDWRTPGRYSFGTATAEVSPPGYSDKKSGYQFNIKANGPCIDDAVDLVELIMTGRIPPDEDYAAEQIASIPKHAGELIHELWILICLSIRSRFKKWLRVANAH
ncbi:hypothetical protein H6775_00205 [Candidatus Nomurabacteria bacterium]|nr:hypothetical protein [Candidatus Nomurabacteria bacterium]